MAAITGPDTDDVDATNRWKEQTRRRDQTAEALNQGNYTESDSVDHLQKWCARQMRWLNATRPGRYAAVSEAIGAIGAIGAIDNNLLERIIEESDLLSIEFFELGQRAAACVGRILTNNEPNGTGFLVAPGLVLTNHHVLKTEESAGASEFELDFEDNRFGVAKTATGFRLSPDSFFLTNSELDFSFVAVESTAIRGGTRLDAYNFLPLVKEQGKARIGQAVNIVQHPRGNAKQVVVRNNRLVSLPPGSPYFHYESDTERGSSGSPVFNDWWEVVALHRRGVPLTNDQDQKIDKTGQVIPEDQPERFVWIGNEGVRISSIVDAFEKTDLKPDKRRYREEALRAWEIQGMPEVSVAGAAPPGKGLSVGGIPLKEGTMEEEATDHLAVADSAPERARRVSEVTFAVPLSLTVSLHVEASGTARPVGDTKS